MADDSISEEARRRVAATTARGAMRTDGSVDALKTEIRKLLGWTGEQITAPPKPKGEPGWLERADNLVKENVPLIEMAAMGAAGRGVGSGGLRPMPPKSTQGQVDQAFARGKRYEDARSGQHEALQERPDLKLEGEHPWLRSFTKTEGKPPTRQEMPSAAEGKSLEAQLKRTDWAIDEATKRGDHVRARQFGDHQQKLIDESIAYAERTLEANRQTKLHNSNLDRGRHWDSEQLRLAAMKRAANRVGQKRQAEIAKHEADLEASKVSPMTDRPIPFGVGAGVTTGIRAGQAYQDWQAPNYVEKTKK